MTENLTKAKELYQDIAAALSSQNADVDRKKVLEMVFELYLICEHGERLCIKNGKIIERRDEDIGIIIDRAFEKLKQNQEKRDALEAEREKILKNTVGVFNKTVER